MQKLTLQQVLKQVYLQHPCHHRSMRAQAAAWYKQGYYKLEDSKFNDGGTWYFWDGKQHVKKYYTGE